MGIDEQPALGAWASRAARPADPATLTALATTAAADLTGPELVDAIVASEKALSLLTGLQMRLMAALALPFLAGDPTRLAARLARKNCITGDDNPENVQLFIEEAATCLAASEIAAALRISPVTGGIRVREATTMTTELAPTLQALETGYLDRGKARIIAEHCQPLTPEHTAELQDLVLPDAPSLSTSELREFAGEAVIIVDPAGSEDRHRAAAARRDLTLRAQPDAMATLSAFLTADGAVKIFQISDLLATSTAGAAGDSRGIGARRIDALVDIADQLMTHGYLDLADFIGQPIPDSATPNGSDQSGGFNCPSPNQSNEPSAKTEPNWSPDTPATDSAATADPTNTADLTHAARGRESGTPNGAACDLPSVGKESVSTNADEIQRSDAARFIGARTAPSTTGTAGPSPVSIAPDRAASAGRSRRALSRQGRRPHLSVTIGLDTLAGLNELPGKLAGFGAIPACLARAIATSAGTVTALITDPTTGIATDAGALTYRPTQRLRDQVAALLNTCQFPSCRQPVWRCDIDHREPYDHQNPEHGGRTDKENAGPFCRRHHLIKHHADWQIRVCAERFTLDWRSPTGHRYKTRPRPVATPDIRNMTAHVTTAGTAIAEKLDHLAVFNQAGNNTSHSGNQPPEPNSTVEELLTTMLLRHQLNQPEMYYDAGESAWDTTDPAWSTGDSDHNAERGYGEEDRELPDEPPF